MAKNKMPILVSMVGVIKSLPIVYIDRFGTERKTIIIREDKNNFFYDKYGRMFKFVNYHKWIQLHKISISTYLDWTTTKSGNVEYFSYKNCLIAEEEMNHYVPDGRHKGYYFNTQEDWHDCLNYFYGIGYINTMFEKTSIWEDWNEINGIYFNKRNLVEISHFGEDDWKEYVLPQTFQDYPNEFWVCPDCGRVYYKSEYEDKIFCHCHNMPIYGYHKWPGKLEFKSSPNENNPKLFYGVEIETENEDEAYRENIVEQMKDIFHLEYDGSLEGSGSFEMISQPMTYDFLIENKDRFKKLFNDLRMWGQVSHYSDNCGLHVHISKAGLNGEEAIQRLVCLVNSFRRNNEIIARREDDTEENGETSFFHYQNTGVFPTQETYDKANKSNHRCAVNVSGEHSDNHNTNTAEIRIFRGTLNFDTFMATMEFVKNLVEIANRVHQTHVKYSDLIYGEYLPKYAERKKGINYEAFIDFAKWHNFNDLKAHAEVYKNIKRRMLTCVEQARVYDVHLSQTTMNRIISEAFTQVRNR